MKILITGAGSVMGQSIYKALAMYNFGEKLEVHFANSNPLGAGRFFVSEKAPIVSKPIVPLAKDEKYDEFLCQYISSNKIDIVFPGTQHELEKIALFRDKTLKAATIPSKIAMICMDKISSTKVLDLYGIRVATTQSLENYLNYSIIDGPVVLKPNRSSSSRNIHYFNNQNEAMKYSKSLCLDSLPFLVQEKLEGDEYTCGCYIDRYSKKISQITFKRILTSDGATLYGEIANNSDIDAYVQAVAHALIDAGLDFGHINVQLILDKKGPCLFEINGRLSSTEASKAHYGFNACAAFVYNLVKEQPFHDWEVAHYGHFIRYYEEIYFS